MTIDPRTVFVVHGRNLEARNAVFAFLKALDLNPLEWEDAGNRTGRATPRTLDSILAGVAASRAAVVLLTGDDLARLRPELGTEPAAHQPRPNVLLEAGLAIALLGEERTVLIRSGATRALSDLDGLNYLELDNTAASRHAFANRLGRAGCPIKTSGTMYLDPATGGDFGFFRAPDGQKATPADRRGGFDDHIVDSTISYTISNLRLMRELETQLKSPGASDLKYCYLGVSGATNWLTLRENAAYAQTKQGQPVLAAIPKLFSDPRVAKRDIDLISLGPGDGELDAGMLVEIARLCRVRNYYPLDVSIELLQQTVERTQKICRKWGIRMKAILGDFLTLRRYRPIYGYDDAVNVISLVGYTFGNYNEGDLVGKLSSGMNAGDFLLLDVRLHKHGSDVNLRTLRTRSEEIVKGFSHEQNNRFAFGPVELLTTARFEDASIRQEVTVSYTVVPGAFNIVTFCEKLDTQMRGGGSPIFQPRLDLAVTTMYDRSAFLEWIGERGFNVVCDEVDGETLVLLLQKA